MLNYCNKMFLKNISLKFINKDKSKSDIDIPEKHLSLYSVIDTKSIPISENDIKYEMNDIFLEISNDEKLKNNLIISKRTSSLNYIKCCNFTEKYILEDPIQSIIDMYII